VRRELGLPGRGGAREVVDGEKREEGGKKRGEF